MNKAKLNNDVSVPCIGFGTMQTNKDAILYAIRSGFRLIDTASIYENEEEVALAIKESNISREDLFITSKLWNTERGYDKTIKAFEKSLKKLDLDYLDLYLIHWPANSKQYNNWDEINLDTWNALIDLYKMGKIRAIGVSNFMPKHMESLLKTEIKPMVNQIKYHPGKNQNEIVEYCKKNNIVVEAWSPLGQGSILDNFVIKDISNIHGKTAAEICIRWCIQNDVIPLPRSNNINRIKENLNVFDFELSKEEMNRINALDDGKLLDSDNVDI